jgi:hypothetical protein
MDEIGGLVPPILAIIIPAIRATVFSPSLATLVIFVSSLLVVAAPRNDRMQGRVSRKSALLAKGARNGGTLIPALRAFGQPLAAPR